MGGEDLPIGEAARRSGVKVPTIRYYEQIGLMPPPPRSDGNRRQFDAADLRRLAFIRHARELGFEIGAIRTLLMLQDQPGRSCAAADEIARARLADVRQRIVSLAALEAELERMLAGGTHGSVEECRVIETLADHGRCRHHAQAPGRAAEARPASIGLSRQDAPASLGPGAGPTGRADT